MPNKKADRELMPLCRPQRPPHRPSKSLLGWGEDKSNQAELPKKVSAKGFLEASDPWSLHPVALC